MVTSDKQHSSMLGPLKAILNLLNNLLGAGRSSQPRSRQKEWRSMGALCISGTLFHVIAGHSSRSVGNAAGNGRCRAAFRPPRYGQRTQASRHLAAVHESVP